uniref:Secreted protein n=1 Tax=Anopheles darlingi TaxID=43151 RepID=A0A2M4DAQ5_ANODA
MILTSLFACFSLSLSLAFASLCCFFLPSASSFRSLIYVNKVFLFCFTFLLLCKDKSEKRRFARFFLP